MSDAFAWLYSDVVKEHFTNPKNVFNPDEGFPYNAEGMTGNIKCGDQMLFMLLVEGDVIKDVRWKTYGCASAIASTSMLSEVVKGMTIKQAYNIKPNDIVAKLGGLPDNKIHCSVLGDKALRAAIDDYLAKNGRAGEFRNEGARIICTCLNISDRDIEEAVKQGARDWVGLQERTKIGTVCGGCKETAEELLHEYVHIFGDE
ncbi:MAG: iron-sulfur cluster assembly scaffold protein [Spirochaetaceae bacterium]|nr:iron-sulfur cluster assembly scaffold protein [Spirochaetaceae bacterium]